MTNNPILKILSVQWSNGRDDAIATFFCFPYAKCLKEGTVYVGLIGNPLIYKQIIIKNLHLELLATFEGLAKCGIQSAVMWHDTKSAKKTAR